jgi:hypothetical protein
MTIINIMANLLDEFPDGSRLISETYMPEIYNFAAQQFARANRIMAADVAVLPIIELAFSGLGFYNYDGVQAVTIGPEIVAAYPSEKVL